MILALLIAVGPVDSLALQDLQKAVNACDRPAVTRTFMGEEERRTDFLVQAFSEQEAITNERATLSDRRKALRAVTVPGDTVDRIRLDGEALSDRQQLLDGKRQLERLRQEAVDQVRRQFLTKCGDRGHKAGLAGAAE